MSSTKPSGNGTNGFDLSLLDPTNRRLLEELRDDPRASYAELGRRVGLSPPAVADRVGRLEAAGIIAGYRTEVDPAAVGLPVAAFVRIRPAPRSFDASRRCSSTRSRATQSGKIISGR